MDFASAKAWPAQWVVMGNNVIKQLAKGKLPSYRSQLGRGRLPSEGKGHTSESCRVRQKINDLANYVQGE